MPVGLSSKIRHKNKFLSFFKIYLDFFRFCDIIAFAGQRLGVRKPNIRVWRSWERA